MQQRQPGEQEFPFSDKEFRFISTLVNKHAGIQLPSHKRSMVYSRLARRVRALHLSGFKEYCELLKNDTNDTELMHCINAITTNLTFFFREPHHFEHLYNALSLIASKPSERKRLRLWSCACSSGQEPYSMAMVTRKVFDRHPNWDIKILATDIDTNMLATASEGIYPQDMLEQIPAQYKHYISSIEEESFQTSSFLKEMIAFKQLNLLDRWPMKGRFDFVFCRNVVIYFDKETQCKLFDRIADILTPDGFLYIGHSENLFNVSGRFKSVGRTIYQRIA